MKKPTRKTTKKRPARKAPAKKKTPAKKKATKKPARKVPAKKKATKKAARKPARKAPAKKVVRKRVPAKKKPAVKKAARKRTPAKKRAPLKQKAFLAAYAACGNISDAARKVKCGRCSHYEWMQDAAYAQAFEEAHEQACDAVDSEIRRRAVTGVRKPVYYMGDIIGTIREYSDVLLIFLAKSLRPEKYRDNVKIEHTGSAELLELLAAGRDRVAKLDESRK